jgi:predicted RNA binding protein YcfA (HicA-like mRNA interferase family)
MKLPRDLSGAELVKCLCKHWDYRSIHQSGSHIILETETPAHQRIPVPNHAALRIGTLHSILRLVSAHKEVSKEDILDSLNE